MCTLDLLGILYFEEHLPPIPDITRINIDGTWQALLIDTDWSVHRHQNILLVKSVVFCFRLTLAKYNNYVNYFSNNMSKLLFQFQKQIFFHLFFCSYLFFQSQIQCCRIYSDQIFQDRTPCIPSEINWLYTYFVQVSFEIKFQSCWTGKLNSTDMSSRSRNVEFARHLN